MRWNKDCFGNVQKKIKTLKEELKRFKEAYRSKDNTEEEEKASDVLDKWMAREELLWK